MSAWEAVKAAVSKPIPIPEVKDEPLPDYIQLGEHRLRCGPDGKWTYVGVAPAGAGGGAGESKAVEELQARVAQLERELKAAQAATLSAQQAAASAVSGDRDGALVQMQAQTAQMQQMQSRLNEAERKYVVEQQKTEELNFKVRVLLAMCTISEGDYLALCQEAGFRPHEHSFLPPSMQYGAL